MFLLHALYSCLIVCWFFVCLLSFLVAVVFALSNVQVFQKTHSVLQSKYPKQIQNHLELISYRCSVKSLFRRKHQWGLENTKKALKFSYKLILVLLPWKTRGVLQFPKVSRPRLLSFRRLGNLSDL